MLGAPHRDSRIGPTLIGVALAIAAGACGGAVTPVSDESVQGGRSGGLGGATDTPQDGGTTSLPQGGSAAATSTGTGLVSGVGGTISAVGGSAASLGGSTGGLDCSHAACPSIPTACTQIVQPAGECCAKCITSTCPPCVAQVCPAGEHSELANGACCPTCVVDPPSACEQGMASYATMRSQLVDKYSTLTCKNSTECTIISENNACAWTCGIPTASSMSSSLQASLDNNAATSCSTCTAPAPILCELMVPACVNGKCIAANPG